MIGFIKCKKYDERSVLFQLTLAKGLTDFAKKEKNTYTDSYYIEGRVPLRLPFLLNRKCFIFS